MLQSLLVPQLGGPFLIVAPHPDDDVLGTGGLIQVAQQFGKSVYVLYVTAGDANGESVTHYLHKPLRPRWFKQLGYVRHNEAVRAEGFLGVPRSHLFFLGFPDSITLDIVTDSNVTRVHRSPTTKLTNAAYSFAYQQYAPYSHASILRLVKSVLLRVKPGTIFVTLRQDIHPDHSAAHIIVNQAVRELGIHPVIYSYLIHYLNWPNPRGLVKPPTSLHLAPPRSLLLTQSQMKRKGIAWHMIRSQSGGSYHDHLIRLNELYWRT